MRPSSQQIAGRQARDWRQPMNGHLPSQPPLPLWVTPQFRELRQPTPLLPRTISSAEASNRPLEQDRPPYGITRPDPHKSLPYQQSVKHLMSPALEYHAPSYAAARRPTPNTAAPVPYPWAYAPLSGPTQYGLAGQTAAVGTLPVDAEWLAQVMQGRPAWKQHSCLTKLRAAGIVDVLQLHNLSEEEWGDLQIPSAVVFALKSASEEELRGARREAVHTMQPSAAPEKPMFPTYRPSVLDRFKIRLRSGDSLAYANASAGSRPKDWLRHDIDFQLLAAVADFDDDGAVDGDEYQSGVRAVNANTTKINKSFGDVSNAAVMQDVQILSEHQLQEQEQRQKAASTQESKLSVFVR